MIEDITPIVITYNEEANIARTLDRLTWARRIVVIDSGSTDETSEIFGRTRRPRWFTGHSMISPVNAILGSRR